MKPQELIYLARVAGASVFKNSSGELRLRSFPRPIYKPHTPEGAAQLRDLWLALKEEHKQSVVKVYLNYINPRLKKIDITHVSRFTSWLFKKPEMACQIIFEVTGGNDN